LPASALLKMLSESSNTHSWARKMVTAAHLGLTESRLYTFSRSSMTPVQCISYLDVKIEDARWKLSPLIASYYSF
jgi:hypothetical protein